MCRLSLVMRGRLVMIGVCAVLLLLLVSVVEGTASVSPTPSISTPSNPEEGSDTTMLMPIASTSAVEATPTPTPDMFDLSSGSGENMSTTEEPTTEEPTTEQPMNTTTTPPTTSPPITTSTTATTVSSTTPMPTASSSDGDAGDGTTTTSSTSSSTKPPTSAVTDPADSSGVVIGVAVGAAGVILLAIVILILVICCLINYGGFGRGSVSGRKKLLEIALEELGTAGPNGVLTLSAAQLFAHIEGDELVRVQPSELSAHVKMLHEEDGYAAEEEYDGVKELDPAPTTSYASQSFNESRNRYINILPNDHTRVVLAQQGKVAGSDYINANFVDGYSSSREYIASQGPLPATVPDFWRMIWEQDTRVIVMVTNPVESQVVKCEEYWPSKGTMQCGGVKITLEGEQLFPEFVVRHFNISKVPAKGKTVSSKHSLTQFHFTSWPDFGVPQEASAMLKFVRHVRRSVCADHGPMVVHCSAGVGRTGTFIAIDILLQKMQEPDWVINVQEVVARMRAQRGLMVQTNAQYLFIYDALLHAHIHGVTEVKSSQLRDHVESLTTPTPSDSESIKCRLDKEFGLVMSVEPPEDCSFESANHSANQPKNRSQDSVPMDMNRVVLEELEGREDTDYINASYIDGYYNRVEFISTQHPLPHTVKDFWRMVMERSINTLVIFGPLKEAKDRYWPVGAEVMEFDNGISVHRVATQEEEGEREEGEEGMGEVEEKGERLSTGGSKVVEGAAEDKKLETAEAGGADEKAKQGEGKEEGGTAGKEEDKKEEGEGSAGKKEESKSSEDKGGTGEKKVDVEAEKAADKGTKADGEGEAKKVASEEVAAKETAGEGTKTTASGDTEAKETASGDTKAKETASGDTKAKETASGDGDAVKEIAKEEVKKEEEAAKEKKENEGGAKNEEMGGAIAGEGKGALKEESEGDKGETSGTSGAENGVVTVSDGWRVVVRRFVVELDDARTHVNMYHLVRWTREGVPTQTTPTLKLIEISRTHWRSTGFNPIAIHTATGVKEEASGVYCGLCILLRQLEVEDAVDVVSTMERIRQQRPAVLTSKDYYRYLYTVLLDAL